MNIVLALVIIIVPIVLIVWLARTLDNRRYKREGGDPPASGSRMVFIILAGFIIVIYIIIRFLTAGRAALEADWDKAIIIGGCLFWIGIFYALYRRWQQRIL